MFARINPRLQFGAAALALALAACSDFLSAPATGPAQLSVEYSLAGRENAERAAAVDFGPVDALRIAVLRDGVALIDTSFAVTIDTEVVRYGVKVEMEEPEAEVELVVTLLWQDRPRFAGSAWVSLVRGARNTAEITLQPVDEVGRLYGRVRDIQTLAPLAGATVTIAGPGTEPLRVVTVGNDGSYSVELPSGEYSVNAAAAGYGGNTAAVQVARLPGGGVVQIGFDLPATTAGQQVSGVAGRVFNAQGLPLAGATVMISGGALTNGVFKSVQTAADGTYTLPGVSLTVAEGQLVPSFSVLAAGSGLQTRQRDGIVLAAGRTLANIDFTLLPGAQTQVFFADGFEAGLAWQAGGLWNRTTGEGIVNTAVPSQARLAPDDTTAARLPRAVEGNQYLWYGARAVGNYLADGENEGTVMSPTFMIPAGVPVASLSFLIWFEVESVNPATFDWMTVSIVDVAAGTAEQIALLNPISDPNLDDREQIPFTSGGFNRAPVFRPVSLDVSQFTGRQIRIAFQFNTGDDRYNYFRGWIVDNVRVTSQGPSSESMLLQAPRVPLAHSTRPR